MMDMRVRARLKCLFLYPKCRATYMCCKVECILSTLFEQLVFMRWMVFREMLVGCCVGPKDDAWIDLIFVSLLWRYSEWKILSRCCILKLVSLAYVMVVSRKLKELLVIGSSLSNMSWW